MMGLSRESKLKEVLDVPEGVAILDQFLPGLTKDPKLKMGANMSLEKLSKLSPQKMKPELLDEIDAALRALGD